MVGRGVKVKADSSGRALALICMGENRMFWPSQIAHVEIIRGIRVAISPNPFSSRLWGYRGFCAFPPRLSDERFLYHTTPPTPTHRLPPPTLFPRPIDFCVVKTYRFRREVSTGRHPAPLLGGRFCMGFRPEMRRAKRRADFSRDRYRHQPIEAPPTAWFIGRNPLFF